MENKRQQTQSTADTEAPTPERVVGGRLRQLREVRELSQEEVARRMNAFGYSWQQTTVAKTEAGARPIRVNEVVDLARVFGVEASDLLTEADQVSEERARLMFMRARLDQANRRVEAAQREHEEAVFERDKIRAAFSDLYEGHHMGGLARMAGTDHDGEH